MLQQPAPEDFVLATGETHPVREFVEKSFAHLGILIRLVISYRVKIMAYTIAVGKDQALTNKVLTPRPARS